MRKPVEKVRIITRHDDVNNLLIELQRHSIVMLERKVQSTQSDKNSWLNRIENVVNELSQHVKDYLFRSLDTNYESYAKDYTEEMKWFDEVEKRLFKINELKDQIIKEKAELDLLKPFSHISFNILPNEELKHVYVKTGTVGIKNLSEFIKSNESQKVQVEVSQQLDNEAVLFIWSKHDQQILVNQIANNEWFNEFDLSRLNEAPKAYVEKLGKINQSKQLELESLVKLHLEDAKQLNRLKLLYEQINNEIVLSEINVKQTDRVSYIDGWVKTSDVDRLDEILKKINITYELENLKPTAEEVVPTAIENPKLIAPFESITNVFSIPNVNEVDPNPSMAFWYWIIFGIMMADIGYGLLLLIGGTILLQIPRLGKGVKDLAKVFTYSSISAIIGGILFGSLFGYSFDLARTLGLPFNSKIIDSVGDPLPMLALSIIIGFLHIMTGLILKIVNSIKQKKYDEMLAQGFSWLFILLGIAWYVLLPSFIGLTLVIIGVVLILLFNGFQNKSIIGKAFGGLTGLFGVTGYLSDVLSYTRILALALSSAVIAFTMNLLAEMVMGGFIGIIFATIIYIIGHIFNLAMSLLSTYVHDGRLQYIEFYGKFFEGDGILFEPLKIELNYYQTITQ